MQFYSKLSVVSLFFLLLLPRGKKKKEESGSRRWKGLLMGLSLKEWDKEVAAKLQSIERHARWIEYHANEIKNALSILKTRPSFETKAEATMESAEKTVSEAIAAYRSKPTGGK